MRAFWKFAAMMLAYKRLLVAAFIAALFDAMCAFAGYGSLTLIVQQLLDREFSPQQWFADKLADPRVVKYIGDQSHLVDHIPPDAFSGFVAILVVIAVLALIGSVARFLHQYFTITVTARTVMTIRKNLFHRLIHVPMAVINSAGTSDRMSRIMRDCGVMGGGFGLLTSKAIRNILQGVSALIVAFLVDWHLTLLFAAGGPIIGILLLKFGRMIRRASERVLRLAGVMFGAIQEALQAARVVKVHQAEGYERRRFNRIIRNMFSEEMTARTAKAVSSPIIELIAMYGLMIVVAAAAWAVFRLNKDPAELISVVAMLGIAGGALKPLVGLNNELQGAAAAATRVEEALNTPVEPNVRGGTLNARRRLPRHNVNVRFDNVSFGYPQTTRFAIEGINLEVPFGTTCAVVGSNGSGKSTLLNLLPRLYEPTEGRVLIDGLDIAACNLRSVRGQMAMVTQETILFDGSIAENIAYGRRHVPRERIIEAAQRAHAHEFISELPDGYDSHVGEWGGRLSGGQRQRIAIARAILRNPAILILDEATSQIDSDSEVKINAALAEFMTDRTTFVIAHRLSTVAGADMIVVMEDGRIASVGRHDQLLKTSDIYRVLCQTQLHAATV